jgi:hypothetical protein
MNEEMLEASLEAGNGWAASADRPDQDNRKVGITVGLRKLGTGLFNVSVDTYFLDGMYGTDISWNNQQFEKLADALKFVDETTGLSREMLKRQPRSS